MNGLKYFVLFVNVWSISFEYFHFDWDLVGKMSISHMIYKNEQIKLQDSYSS